jgi:hypothetical protein
MSEHREERKTSCEHADPAKFPEVATAAAARYFKASCDTFHLFMFVLQTAVSSDYAQHVASNYFEEAARSDGNPGAPLGKCASNPDELATTKQGPRLRFLRERSQTLFEMFTARCVDNFQTYLVDIVRQVLRVRPEMLNSSQPSVSLEEVLKYKDMKEFINDLIERKVNALSSEGFVDLQDWCQKRGIPMLLTNADQDAVVELVATRNLISHGRGLIDERYSRAVRTSTLAVGALRKLKVDYLLNAFALLNRIVTETDSAVAVKFQIATEPLMTSSPVSE